MKRFVVILLILIGVISLILLIKPAFLNPTSQKLRGQIVSPLSNQLVSRTIECSGTLIGLKSSQYAWLMARETNKDLSHNYWPKRQLVPDSLGNWKAVVFQDGRSKSISLSLMVVPDSIHLKIQAWNEAGMHTGKFPFMKFDSKFNLHTVENISISNPIK